MFDIMLPSINRSSLSSSVQSILEQNFDKWHLYIIGDGFQPEYNHPKITCISIPGPNNDWGAKARNVGIGNGHNDWIAFIDDDDRWYSNHLSVLEQLSLNGNLLRTAGRSFRMRRKHPRTKQMVKKIGPVNQNDVLCVGMSFTRELFNKTQGFSPFDNHDLLIWKQMLDLGGIPNRSQIVTFEFER